MARVLTGAIFISERSEKNAQCKIQGDRNDVLRAWCQQDAELSLCDCEKTAFKDAGFYAVITTDTCYFRKDPQKVLAEIKRITVPSGKLVIAYNAMYAASVHKSMGTAMYSDESILAELEKAGIRVTSKCSCGLRQTVFTAIL